MPEHTPDPYLTQPRARKNVFLYCFGHIVLPNIFCRKRSHNTRHFVTWFSYERTRYAIGVPICYNGRSHEPINGACLSHRLPASGLPRVRRKPLFLLFLHDSTLGALSVTFSGLLLVLVKWADPGGTAIPGQPVTRAEQAPDISSVSKNQFNIEVPQWGTYQILSW